MFADQGRLNARLAGAAGIPTPAFLVASKASRASTGYSAVSARKLTSGVYRDPQEALELLTGRGAPNPRVTTC